jgi:methyl coenzyme M reductase alpha subunit
LYDRIFIGGLFSAAVGKSGYSTAENDRMIDELQRMRQEAVVPAFT